MARGASRVPFCGQKSRGPVSYVATLMSYVATLMSYVTTLMSYVAILMSYVATLVSYVAVLQRRKQQRRHQQLLNRTSAV